MLTRWGHAVGECRLLYGTFLGHTPGFTSLLSIKSTDGGTSWQYLSTIAGYDTPDDGFGPPGTPQVCHLLFLFVSFCFFFFWCVHVFKFKF